MPPEIISIHIPKCAGMSFRHTLGACTGGPGTTVALWNKRGVHPQPSNPQGPLYDSSLWPAWKAEWDKALTDPPPPDRIKALHGHVPVQCFDDLWPNAKRITWLRHPLARVVSALFFSRQLGQDLGLSLMEMIELPNVINNMTMFCGGDLSRFSWVGIVENYDFCLKDLAARLNWGDVPEVKGNATKYPPGEPTRTFRDMDFVQRFAELNQADIELYEEACQRWKYAIDWEVPHYG